MKTNKSLKAEWEPRRKNVLQLIRDIALIKLGEYSSITPFLYSHILLDTVSPSLARSTCRELVLTILKDLPESLMDESTLSKVSVCIEASPVQVQIARSDVSPGYRSLHRGSKAVVRYTALRGAKTNRVPRC